MIKRCLVCKKMLWTKYDVVSYLADDEHGNPKPYRAYLCRGHGDELDREPEPEAAEEEL